MLQEDLDTQKEEYTPAVNVNLFIIIICKTILNIWNLLKNFDRDMMMHKPRIYQKMNIDMNSSWLFIYHEMMNFKITMVQKWINQMKKEKVWLLLGQHKYRVSLLLHSHTSTGNGNTTMWQIWVSCLSVKPDVFKKKYYFYDY